MVNKFMIFSRHRNWIYTKWVNARASPKRSYGSRSCVHRMNLLRRRFCVRIARSDVLSIVAIGIRPLW